MTSRQFTIVSVFHPCESVAGMLYIFLGIALLAGGFYAKSQKN